MMADEKLNKFERMHQHKPICPKCCNGLLKARGIYWECENCGNKEARQWKNDPIGSWFFPKEYKKWYQKYIKDHTKGA